MSTMPKVSVVTTTYNDMDNLCRIMEEVRKQTYKNIEHIIVDGVLIIWHLGMCILSDRKSWMNRESGVTADVWKAEDLMSAERRAT